MGLVWENGKRCNLPILIRKSGLKQEENYGNDVALVRQQK